MGARCRKMGLLVRPHLAIAVAQLAKFCEFLGRVVGWLSTGLDVAVVTVAGRTGFAGFDGRAPDQCIVSWREPD